MSILTKRVTEDVGQQARLLGDWEQRYIQLSPGQFEGSVIELELGRLKLAREQMNTVVHQVAAPMPRMVGLSLPVNKCRLQHLDWRQNIHNGRVLMMPTSKYHGVTSTYSDILVLSVDQELLYDHAHGLGVECRDAMPRALVLPPGFKEFALQLFSDAVECAGRFKVAERRREVLDILATSICAASVAPSVSWRSDRNSIVNNACDAVAEVGVGNASLHTMCIGANVSLRILQQAFQEIIGISPLRWLKLARLNAAKHDLLNSPGRSVTEVALAYAFTHFGRFSAEYRSIFYEAPRDTTKRRSFVARVTENA